MPASFRRRLIGKLRRQKTVGRTLPTDRNRKKGGTNVDHAARTCSESGRLCHRCVCQITPRSLRNDREGEVVEVFLIAVRTSPACSPPWTVPFKTKVAPLLIVTPMATTWSARVLLPLARKV